ncbi:MAG: hypothetical protein ACXQS8_05320 [Candidatus Helarchaeales archaeon]
MTKAARWLSDTAKKVLLHGIDGISIKDLVDELEGNYKSRDACWAAISRLTKSLNEKGLIQIQGKNRTRFLITTLKGKDKIKKDLPLNLPEKIRLKTSANSVVKSNSSDKLDDLIMEILAKRGELTIQDLSNFLNVDENVLSLRVENLVRKKILTKETRMIKKNSIEFYYLNWTLVHGPISKIIPEDNDLRSR